MDRPVTEIAARPRRSAFTLVELMIVVATLGVLASMAIPVFVKYFRRSKTVEALMNLRKLYDSSTAYFVSGCDERNPTRDGVLATRQFPATQERTPADRDFCAVPGNKFDPRDSDWRTPTWQALNFALSDPHYFKYSYESAGLERESRFTARANGDLDCNKVESTFERVGSADGDLNVRGGEGVFIRNEIE
ncbi:MAG: type II secretion system protein [Deltaproteobacteria bacterium]|nr:type II secretion system protein [Deltaproteobacteria bacterium]